jgi:hypothetical protein
MLVAEQNGPTMMARIGMMRGAQSARRASVKYIAQRYASKKTET